MEDQFQTSGSDLEKELVLTHSEGSGYQGGFCLYRQRRVEGTKLVHFASRQIAGFYTIPDGYVWNESDQPSNHRHGMERGKERNGSSLANKDITSTHFSSSSETLDYHVIKQASVPINPKFCSASFSLPINYSGLPQSLLYFVLGLASSPIVYIPDVCSSPSVTVLLCVLSV